MINDGSTRQLSLWRVLVALILLAVLGVGAYFGFQKWLETQSSHDQKAWFGAYVDVTSTPQYPIDQLDSTPSHTAILAFIVSSPNESCSPSWGGAYTMDQASANLDLDRRIARLRQQGGNIGISFGGQKNDELAVKCVDSDKLTDAYRSVIDRYQVNTIDLDLEGLGLTDTEALKRRAVVLANLQRQQKSQNKNLAIWLTLPVTPQGLTPDGTNAVSVMLESGVDLSGINVMTMDYGSSLQNGQSMEQASENALIETHRQLGILYKQTGITLSANTLWTKIGATPMIGQNDVSSEIFNISDASRFNKFTQNNGVGRMSMWSINRDIQCGDNYVNVKIVSDSCSGVKQDKLQFSNILSKGFVGELNENAKVITTQDDKSNVVPTDDPTTSPYQIWQEDGVYLENTKVVWHKNVYQAKWWTQGDLPDNPVLQSYQTPWQLIGPVLPGEKPVPQPTLPAGTYPEWSGTKEYTAGQRVLLNGLPYQAKWWTKGDSPAASSVNPTNSPWLALSQAQFNEALKQATSDTH